MKKLLAGLLLLALAVGARADGITSTPVTGGAIIGACSASASQIFYDNAGTCAGLATANNAFISTNGSGVPAWAAAGTNVLSLLAANASAATWTCSVLSNASSYCSATVGQLPGTTTNDNASAGNIGEVMSSTCPSAATTATVTITIAAPGVITWTAHGFTTACPVVFTTTGALPTGITSGTVYWVVPSSITTNTFTIATSIPNALAGTQITTSGTQSGTQTGTAGAAAATTANIGLTGLALTAGDWECYGLAVRGLAASTSVTLMKTSIGQSVADATLKDGSMDQFSTAANVMVNDHTRRVGPVRESLSATTNVYLSMTDTFTVSTNKIYGTLKCIRAR